MDDLGLLDPLKRADPVVMLDDDDAACTRNDHDGVASHERLADHVGVGRSELVQVLGGHEERGLRWC
ncbi:hypothetical protein [Actinomadura nitritigenes]|uniref:hypothetical protein n=1 Tax=Actinomadura nitritigenes TaxID=134602 RepID=UPI003D8E015E